MITSTELNSREINQLRFILPPLDDQIFNEFIQLVHNLIITQLLLKPDTSATALSAGDLRTDLKKLKDHYQRAIDGLRALRRRGIFPTIFDQHYLIANQTRPQASLNGDNEDHADLDSSEVEKKTKELLLAVESFESDIEVSRGRPRASKNMFLIIEIAKFFESNIPKSRISASTDTRFFQVVKFILSDVLSSRLANSEESTIEDPKRQIENTLKVFKEFR
jgi:hypothetical protein